MNIFVILAFFILFGLFFLALVILQLYTWLYPFMSITNRKKDTLPASNTILINP